MGRREQLRLTEIQNVEEGFHSCYCSVISWNPKELLSVDNKLMIGGFLYVKIQTKSCACYDIHCITRRVTET